MTTTVSAAAPAAKPAMAEAVSTEAVSTEATPRKTMTRKAMSREAGPAKAVAYAAMAPAAMIETMVPASPATSPAAAVVAVKSTVIGRSIILRVAAVVVGIASVTRPHCAGGRRETGEKQKRFGPYHFLHLFYRSRGSSILKPTRPPSGDRHRLNVPVEVGDRDCVPPSDVPDLSPAINRGHTRRYMIRACLPPD